MRKPALVLGVLACVSFGCSQWPGSAPTAPSVGPTVSPGGSVSRDAGAVVRAPGAPVLTQALRLDATVRFGQTNVGSPFPPTSGHDQSAHAADNLVPRTVVIDRGGTVTFQVPASVHQIAIYEPGKGVKDVDTAALSPIGQAGCPPGNLLINDAIQRAALFLNPCFSPWQVEYQFNDPGRYLVICAFVFHFEVGMYGWVEVRDRQT